MHPLHVHPRFIGDIRRSRANVGDLPLGALGRLPIDEPGQVLPQAAVGAIMRSRRTIVAGDPLQTPPVIKLPEQLIAEIIYYFKIDMQLWSASEASTQTVVDRTSGFQAEFRSDPGPRKVGIPLLEPLHTSSSHRQAEHESEAG